jgi:hypothetical protein
MTRLTAFFIVAFGALALAQPQPGVGVWTQMRALIANVGTVGSDPSVQELDVVSGADDLGGGIRVSRADANASYVILNMNDASAFATIQAGDSVANLPIRLSPNGGGVSVGGGNAVLKVLTGVSSWDPASIADGAAASAAVTVIGVTTASTCFGSFSSIGSVGVAVTAQASAADTVIVLVTNNSGSAQDFGAGTARAVCFTY